MRDSGKDRVDEIKLNRLLDCPFFTDQDFNEIMGQSFLQTELDKKQRRSTISCFPQAMCNQDAEAGSRIRGAKPARPEKKIKISDNSLEF